MKPIIVFLSILFMAKSSLADLRGLPQITVLASYSLTKPLTEISRIYSRENNITVTTSFDEMPEQVREIGEGGAADILISSHPKWITDVKQKGLIDVSSISNLVKNKLALVTSTDSRLNKYILKDAHVESQIMHLSIRTIMVLGNPQYSTLGIYTKQALDALGKETGTDLWDKIENNVVKVLNTVSSENAVYLITKRQSTGIVFYSDAKDNKKLNIVSIFDDSLHDPIIYQGAVVAGKNMKLARNFLSFLKTHRAIGIFKKHGFSF